MLLLSLFIAADEVTPPPCFDIVIFYADVYYAAAAVTVLPPLMLRLDTLRFATLFVAFSP